MNRIQKLSLDSSGNVLVSLLANVISLISLPYYLETYGDTMWGIYIWASSVSGFLSSFDFGVKAGLRRFVARYTKLGDKQEIEIGLSLSIFIVLVVGLINFSLILGLSFIPTIALKLDQEFIETGRYVLIAASVYSLFFWGTMILESILEGYQLYTSKNGNRIIGLILQLGVYLGALVYKIDFLWLVVFLFLAKSSVFILHLKSILFRRLVSGLIINLKIKKADFKTDFFKFSSDVFLLGLLQLLVFKADVFIIGATLGGALVTKYVVITKPMFIIKMVDSYMFSAVQPLLATEHAEGNYSFLNRFIINGALFNFMVLSPLCMIVAFLIKPFLNLWVGSGYNDYVLWGQLACLMYLIRPFYGAITKALLNSGKTKSMLRVKIIFSLTTFISSVVLVFYFNIGGVILGSLLGILINVPLYFGLLRSEFNLSYKDVISNSVMYLHGYITVVTVVVYLALPYFALTEWYQFLTFALIITFMFYIYSGYYLVTKERLLEKLLKK